MPSYVFTGDQPEEFPSLSYDLIQAGAEDAVVQPGASVVTTDPVVHPRLKPTDPTELAAWGAVYTGPVTVTHDNSGGPSDVVQAAEYVNPPVTPEPPAEPAPLPEG